MTDISSIPQDKLKHKLKKLKEEGYEGKQRLAIAFSMLGKPKK